MENVVELIPHCLGRAPPLLLEHYIKALRPFSPKKHIIYSKEGDTREAFYFGKNHKIKVSWLGPIPI